MPYKSVAMSLAEELHNDGEPWVPEDTFGSRLALVRQRRGWNIAEAARACKVDPQSWANWEAGASPRKFEQVIERTRPTGSSGSSTRYASCCCYWSCW